MGGEGLQGLHPPDRLPLLLRELRPLLDQPLELSFELGLLLREPVRLDGTELEAFFPEPRFDRLDLLFL